MCGVGFFLPISLRICCPSRGFCRARQAQEEVKECLWTSNRITRDSGPTTAADEFMPKWWGRWWEQVSVPSIGAGWKWWSSVAGPCFLQHTNHREIARYQMIPFNLQMGFWCAQLFVLPPPPPLPPMTVHERILISPLQMRIALQNTI